MSGAKRDVLEREYMGPRQGRWQGGDFSGGNGSLLGQIHEIDKRLARIEERLTHMPTKAWILAGVITAIVTASLLALALLRILGD